MKLLLLRCLAIGTAGFFGSVTRYLVGVAFQRYGMRFPLGTLVINVTGSLFLGWFVPYCMVRNVSEATRLAIAVGFVGAYTTFSTFMYDTTALAREGLGLEAALNLFGSLILGLAAAWLGMMMAPRA